jgi:hypothetical protein
MPTFCTITAITAFSPNDIWAAGNGAWPGFQGPLLFHWNGTAWTAVQVGINQQLSSFTAVVGRSPTDLWAVGNVFNSGVPVVMHGDGVSWTVVDGMPEGLLPGLALDAGGRPWVLRNTRTPEAYLSTCDVAGSWTHTPAPRSSDTVGNSLSAITAVPGTSTMFAVGDAYLPTEPRAITAIIEEYVADAGRAG